MEAIWVLVRGCFLLWSWDLWHRRQLRLHHHLPFPRGSHHCFCDSCNYCHHCYLPMFMKLISKMRKQTFNQLLAGLAFCEIMWVFPSYFHPNMWYGQSFMKSRVISTLIPQTYLYALRPLLYQWFKDLLLSGKCGLHTEINFRV